MSYQHRNHLYNRLIHRLHKPKAKTNHWLRAKRTNGRGIHSPYLYRFVTMVLNNPWPFYAFEEMEALHQQSRNRFRIPFARKNPHRVEQTLFRIVQDRQPANILEIGFRNEFETSVFKQACSKALIKSITYPSDSKTLRFELSQLERLDFVFFNATTDSAQRMEEYRSCLKNIGNDAIFVIRNIHRTPEQSFTWKVMRNQPEVRTSIDLYNLGILFFRKDLPKCKLRLKLH